MSKNKNNCHMDQSDVHHLNHTKLGTTHILGGLHDTEGMVSAVFLAKADYVKGDSFMLEAETYIASSQDDVVLVSGFFKAGSLVHVLVDTEKKRLGFTRGTNGAEKAPLSAEGHLLVGDSEGNPADSGKTVDDFDPAGSAQTVQVELEKHEANAERHVTNAERNTWNNKADRAPEAVAGHLAALDEWGNPVDSGKAPEDFDAAGSAQAVRSELELHEGNGDVHLAPDERDTWNGKADRDYVDTQLSDKANMGAPEIHLPAISEDYKYSTAERYDSQLFRNAFDEVTLLFAINKKSGYVQQGDRIFTLAEGFRPKINTAAIAVPVTMHDETATPHIGEVNIFGDSGIVLVNLMPNEATDIIRVRGNVKFLAR